MSSDSRHFSDFSSWSHTQVKYLTDNIVLFEASHSSSRMDETVCHTSITTTVDQNFRRALFKTYYSMWVEKCSSLYIGQRNLNMYWWVRDVGMGEGSEEREDG